MPPPGCSVKPAVAPGVKGAWSYTDGDADWFDDGADERGDVVQTAGVGALHKLQTQTEADDRLVAQQRYRHSTRSFQSTVRRLVNGRYQTVVGN